MVADEPTLWEWAWHFSWLTSYVSFLWLPIVFVAYPIGRRKTCVRLVLAFVAIEAMAVALALCIYRSLQTASFLISAAPTTGR